MTGIPTDPWSAAFTAFGPALTAAVQPGGPSMASQSTSFDSSGWTVNAGSGSATATRTSLPTATQSLQAASAGIAGALGSPVILIALVLAYVVMKHK
jgi:hypothetical protein